MIRSGRSISLWIACVALGMVAWWSGRPVAQVQRASPEEIHVGADALMVQKLGSAQEVLRGLALEDFKLIERESQRLQLLSLDVGWNIVQTSDYARLSVEFRKAAEQIKLAAEKENLDAAGLGYFKLTMTCIDCHRHVRDDRKEKKQAP